MNGRYARRTPCCAPDARRAGATGWAALVAAMLTGTPLIMSSLIMSPLVGLVVIVAVLAGQALAQAPVSVSQAAISVIPAPQASAFQMPTAQITPIRDASGNLTRQGYTVSLMDNWPAQFGYRPVHISIQANPPLAQDATVTVEFQVVHFGYGQSQLVEEDFTLPAGQPGPVLYMMSVPILEPSSYFVARFWINGVAQPDLRLSSATLGSRGLEPRRHILRASDLGGPALDWNAVIQPDSRHIATLKFPLDWLSRRWLDYTSCSAVCLNRKELATLIHQHPRRWKALRLWVAGGGNLWIDEVGSNLQTWPEVARLLELPADGLQPGTVASPPVWRVPRINFASYWYSVGAVSDTLLLPNPAGRAPSAPASFGALPLQADMVPVREENGQIIWEEAPPTVPPTEEIPRSTANPFKPQLSPEDAMDLLLEEDSPERLVKLRDLAAQEIDPIRECSLGLGHVVLFGGNWQQDLGKILDHDLQPDFAAPRRLDPDFIQGETLDYWDWVIPGVGKPPVFVFQVLISLFVIAIGPLNYFMLRRKRRLHLLVVTVPLSAAVVTFGLVGYAVMADGFGTRVRVRSFTLLDQQRGEAACLSRQTYYAGIAPSDGLHFPADVAVVRKLADDSSARNITYKTVWEDDQHLAEGWIRSRSMAQFTCQRSRPTSARLQVDSSQDNPPRVTNRLGTHIQALLLSDDAGNVYAASDIAADAHAALQADQVGAASRAMREAITANQLGDEITINQYGSPIAASDQSYLEWLIAQTAAAARPAGVPTSAQQGAKPSARQGAGQAVQLSPRTYLAIVEKSPEVVFGCEAQQEQSLHIIRGKW